MTYSSKKCLAGLVCSLNFGKPPELGIVYIVSLGPYPTSPQLDRQFAVEPSIEADWTQHMRACSAC